MQVLKNLGVALISCLFASGCMTVPKQRIPDREAPSVAASKSKAVLIFYRSAGPETESNLEHEQFDELEMNRIKNYFIQSNHFSSVAVEESISDDATVTNILLKRPSIGYPSKLQASFSLVTGLAFLGTLGLVPSWRADEFEWEFTVSKGTSSPKVFRYRDGYHAWGHLALLLVMPFADNEEEPQRTERNIVNNLLHDIREDSASQSSP